MRTRVIALLVSVGLTAADVTSSASAANVTATAKGTAASVAEKRGYWWKKEPPAGEATEPAHRELGPPPTEVELLKLHPQEIEKLVEEYREYALWRMSKDTVRWYFEMQDFARRRARAFMNVTEVVMLENADLNMQTVYPTNPAGQQARAMQRAGSRESRIQGERERAALVMLSREGCGYCDAQRAVLKHFAQKFDWEIVEIDVVAQPQVAAKFAAESTPTTVVIFRDSPSWQPVSLGVDTLEGLEEQVYRALRYTSGEVQADQYTLQEFQDGGLYDPQRRKR